MCSREDEPDVGAGALANSGAPSALGLCLAVLRIRPTDGHFRVASPHDHRIPAIGPGPGAIHAPTKRLPNSA